MMERMATRIETSRSLQSSVVQGTPTKQLGHSEEDTSALRGPATTGPGRTTPERTRSVSFFSRLKSLCRRLMGRQTRGNPEDQGTEIVETPKTTSTVPVPANTEGTQTNQLSTKPLDTSKVVTKTVETQTEPETIPEPKTIAEAVERYKADQDDQKLRISLNRIRHESGLESTQPEFGLQMAQTEIDALYGAIDAGNTGTIEALLAARKAARLEHMIDNRGRSLWEAALSISQEMHDLLPQADFVQGCNMTAGEIRSLFKAIDKLDTDRITQLLAFRSKADLNKIRNEQEQSVFDVAGMKRENKDDPSYQIMLEVLNQHVPKTG